MPSHRATLLLVSVVDGVVAVEIITVLRQNLREHDVSLIPRSRINIRISCNMIGFKDPGSKI